jgi:hypothetical protein
VLSQLGRVGKLATQAKIFLRLRRSGWLWRAENRSFIPQHKFGVELDGKR